MSFIFHQLVHIENKKIPTQPKVIGPITQPFAPQEPIPIHYTYVLIMSTKIKYIQNTTIPQNTALHFKMKFLRLIYEISMDLLINEVIFTYRTFFMYLFRATRV